MLDPTVLTFSSTMYVPVPQLARPTCPASVVKPKLTSSMAPLVTTWVRLAATPVLVSSLWPVFGVPATGRQSLAMLRSMKTVFGAGVAVGDAVAVGVGVAGSVQPRAKKLVILATSEMSTKPSTGSGAMLSRGGAGGTARLKLLVRAATSVMSENTSLLMSAGQALVPHWTRALVPARSSTAELKPSQSVSFGPMSQRGKAWEPFGQAGQLSLRSETPSPSKSQLVPTQTDLLTFAICSPPRLEKLLPQAYVPAVDGLTSTTLLLGEERPAMVSV